MLNGCRHYMNTKFNAKVYIVTEDMHGCGIRAQKCACGGGLTSCEEEKRSRPAGDVWLTARMATIHATNNNFMFRFKILLRCVFVSQPFETELEEIFSIIDNCLPDTFNHNSNAECQGHKMTFWATTPPFKLKRCLTFYRSR